VQLRRLVGVARNRVEGLLEQGGIKLTAVATDPFGVSGWAMLKMLDRLLLQQKLHWVELWRRQVEEVN